MKWPEGTVSGDGDNIFVNSVIDSEDTKTNADNLFIVVLGRVQVVENMGICSFLPVL